MISKVTPICASRDCRHAARQASSLRAGMITDTAGGRETVSVAGIRRIYYYSWVRRILRFARPVVPEKSCRPLRRALLAQGRLYGTRSTLPLPPGTSVPGFHMPPVSALECGNSRSTYLPEAGAHAGAEECAWELFFRPSGASSFPSSSNPRLAPWASVDPQGVAQGLIVTALAKDGIIEAAEFANGYPLLAVQFHPERMADKKPFAAFFEWLVEAATSTKHQIRKSTDYTDCTDKRTKTKTLSVKSV